MLDVSDLQLAITGWFKNITKAGKPKTLTVKKWKTSVIFRLLKS